MTTTTRSAHRLGLLVASILRSGGAAAPAVGGLRRPDAGHAARTARRRRPAGADRRSRQARRRHEGAEDRPRHGASRRPGDDLRQRPARRQGRAAHLGHRQRRLDARPARRQRRLPGPQDHQVHRAALDGEDGRQRRVQRQAEGADRLRRHPRHLRRRRRNAGREGRAPDRPRRIDHPEVGADRDDGHAHLQRARLEPLRGRRVRPLRQQVRRRRDGQLDSRHRPRAVPRQRAGRQAHDRDRRRDLLQVPQHPAVADPVGNRLQVRLRGHEGQRPARAAHRLAGQHDGDGRLAHDPQRRQPRHRRRLDRGDGEPQRHDRPGRLVARRQRERAHPRRARRPRLGDGGREPRQLHRRLLVVHLGSARNREGGGRRNREEPDQGAGRARRLARRPGQPGRRGQGPGAVLRQAQLRRAGASRGSSSRRGSGSRST